MKGSGICCTVRTCKNSQRYLFKWKNTVCSIHNGIRHSECSCLIPFGFHTFPKNENLKNLWIEALRLKKQDVSKYARVCGIHFEEGRPTRKFPIPTLNIGQNENDIASHFVHKTLYSERAIPDPLANPPLTSDILKTYSPTRQSLTPLSTLSPNALQKESVSKNPSREIGFPAMATFKPLINLSQDSNTTPGKSTVPFVHRSPQSRLNSRARVRLCLTPEVEFLSTLPFASPISKKTSTPLSKRNQSVTKVVPVSSNGTSFLNERLALDHSYFKSIPQLEGQEILHHSGFCYETEPREISTESGSNDETAPKEISLEPELTDKSDNKVKHNNVGIQCAVSVRDTSTQWEDLPLHDHSYVQIEGSLKKINEKAIVGTQINLPTVAHDTMCNTDTLFYTGLPLEIFILLLNYLKKYVSHFPFKMPVGDQFLIVLMRLRLGLLLEDLARRFLVSPALIWSQYKLLCLFASRNVILTPLVSLTVQRCSLTGHLFYVRELKHTVLTRRITL